VCVSESVCALKWKKKEKNQEHTMEGKATLREEKDASREDVWRLECGGGGGGGSVREEDQQRGLIDLREEAPSWPTAVDPREEAGGEEEKEEEAEGTAQGEGHPAARGEEARRWR
jgi:hypothetical protein